MQSESPILTELRLAIHPGGPVWTARRRREGEANGDRVMEELNGRMLACQILITGLIAKVANNSPDPLRFLSDFRDEILAVIQQVNISGTEDTTRVRNVARKTADELFSLMKPPSED